MKWNDILKMDGFKVFIILVLLLFPYIVHTGIGSSSSIEGNEYEMNFSGDAINIGLPFTYIHTQYTRQSNFIEPDNTTVGIVTRFSGSYLNFILDILIAYLIGVSISFIYYKRKEK